MTPLRLPGIQAVRVRRVRHALRRQQRGARRAGRVGTTLAAARRAMAGEATAVHMVARAGRPSCRLLERHVRRAFVRAGKLEARRPGAARPADDALPVAERLSRSDRHAAAPQGGGKALAILSNGTPRMLASAVNNAGIAELLDAVLSVEEVGVFKPHPSVYWLAADRLQLAPEQICFLSSNGWDAYAANAFGFRAVWCNRFGQAPERIPATPDGQIATLAALPEIVIA